MKVIYQEGLSKTQINKAKDLIKFLDKKLYLGINRAVNYQHNVVVTFDYLTSKYTVKEDQEGEY